MDHLQILAATYRQRRDRLDEAEMAEHDALTERYRVLRGDIAAEFAEATLACLDSQAGANDPDPVPVEPAPPVTSAGRDLCAVCRRGFSVTRAGVLRQHQELDGHRICRGAGQPPLSMATTSDTAVQDAAENGGADDNRPVQDAAETTAKDDVDPETTPMDRELLLRSLDEYLDRTVTTAAQRTEARQLAGVSLTIPAERMTDDELVRLLSAHHAASRRLQAVADDVEF